MNKSKTPDNTELLNLQPIAVGEILVAFKDFQNIFENKLKKNPEIFSGLPLKIVIKRISNQKVVDLVGIKRIEMSKDGSCIWLVCFVNETDSIFIHNKSIVKLKLATKPISEVSKGLDFFKNMYEKQFNKTGKTFFDLPVRVVIMSGKEGESEKLVDTLDIATLLMDDVGSGIFCHSLIDDIDMIKNNPKLEKLLNESETQYAQLMKELNQKF